MASVSMTLSWEPAGAALLSCDFQPAFMKQ
jgi:hypothetical protein